jgi:tight adherence protein B
MEKDGAALLLLLFVLVLAMLGVVLFVTGSSRRAALAERGRGANDDAAVTRLRQSFDAWLRRRPSGRRLGNWLQGAGSPLSPADLLLLCVSGTLFLTVVLSLFTPLGVSLLFAVAGVAGIARVLVERKRGQRRDEFINQLPDVARVLSNGTSAGLSMAGAMELAARELAQPAATEMEVVVQETRLGMPLESSLERLRDRLPSREVAVLMTTLIIQQRAGGDTVRALSELGQTLEARKDLLREIRTMLSGAVFTSYLVAMMGAGTLVLVNLISPGIMTELTTTLPGILALSMAVILYVVAFVIIRGITKVEV